MLQRVEVIDPPSDRHGPRHDRNAVDVVLVSMPYAAVERPSVALGTLAAALEREDIPTRTIHGNLTFAERIGRGAYEFINNSDITMQIGEWTFGEAAFGPAASGVAAYVAFLRAGGFPATGLEDWLVAIRAAATTFVTDLAAEIVALRPRIVGCSSVFQQHCASLALLRHIRERDPTIVTMMGGANCEAAMGAATHRHYPWVDFVVSGEADALLPGLCRQAFAQGSEVSSVDLPYGVLGRAARQRDSDPADAPPAPRVLVEHLDDLPIPDFDDYFEQLAESPLRDHILPGLAVETSRGCWWGAKHHCTFCGLNGVGMAFRAKSEDRVEDELRWLSERHGLKNFMTVDNILDHRYFRRVLPSLATRGDMLFFYETKANLSRAQVETLSRAGVRWIQPGIEALNDDLLKLLDKGCSTAVNVQLLKWAYNNGIWIIWNHLYGAPGDRPEWYEKTADWLMMISHLQAPPTGSMVRIRYDRFSPYFNKAAAFGLSLVPYPAYSYAYPLDPDALSDQAYFFRHDGPVGAAPARLMALIREWAALFYGPPVANVLPRRSATAPVLAMTDDGTRIEITDTRPCAVAARHALDARESRICRACDGARSADGIVEALRAAGDQANATVIARARQSLVDRKIVADFDGKFLCLATEAAPIPYERFEDFAGGLLLTAGRRPAVRPGDPWKRPVQELFPSS